MRRPHADVTIAAIVLVSAAAVFAVTFTFDKVPEALMQGLGAEIFPRLVLGTIGILAVALALQARGRADEPRETVPPMVYATAAAMIAFFGGVWLIGMLPSMFVFLVGVGWMWGERRLVPLLASAAVLCFVIWLVFVRLFGIALPHSMLSERLF
jgi:hypothetical protein